MNTIRQLRKETHISQQKLSQLLGISQQSVSRIENMENLNNVPGYLLMKFAEAFQVTIEELVGSNKLLNVDKQEDELWKIYKQLDSVNKETLLVMGRRLYDTQENSNHIQEKNR